jgi:hypothetical protein
MGTVQATLDKRSADEFRALLEEVLSELDGDQKAGPLLRAAGLRLRFEFPDIGLVLNAAASEDTDHHLRWAFSDGVPWEPRLTLSMNSEVANAYLQGEESLAIAIARRRVRLSGEQGYALVYVPALRLVVERYRQLVRAQYPHLALH